jgi:hypothetical protein
VRIGAIVALVVVITMLVGCGESLPSSPSPSSTATPDAVAYADPTALYAAIEKSGAPRVEGFEGGHPFSAGDAMPPEAQAVRANFMVAISSDRYMLPLSDGTPGALVIAAVFPDASARRLGAAFGRHMAGAVDVDVWQLQGPNWLIWSVDEEALQRIQGAIGGQLKPMPKVTASPGASA